MKKILITGVGGPAGVNFVNSLRYSKEKMCIIGSDINKYHLEWADLNKKYLSPRSSDENYCDFLNKIIKKEGIEFLHPQPDDEVKAVSDSREKLEAKTFLPSKKTIDICQNKYESAKTWLKKGIILHDSIMIKSDNDIKRALNTFGDIFWLRAVHGAGGRGSTLVNNFNTAKNWISYWKSREINWDFVAQKYLSGKNYAFQSLWKNGEIITSQARERIEYIYPQLSPSGITGTPSVAVTVHNEQVNQTATKAILSIDSNATGIFCVDLKEDENGIPNPTEINAGRFFTTSFFFTKAGINMPYIYVKLAYNEKIPEIPKYNAIPKGLYWIRHIDCPAVLKEDKNWAQKI